MSRLRRITAARALGGCLLVLVVGLPPAASSVGGHSQYVPNGQQRTTRPNVLLVITDDQDAASVRPDTLPSVLSLWAANGVTFSQAFAQNPLCCPDRASLLTGQLAQNHGVWLNILPGGWSALDYTSTLGVWAQRAGYTTGWIGKFLNNYGIDAHPTIPGTNKCRQQAQGFDFWWVLLKNEYNDYSVNANGVLTSYGSASLPSDCGPPDATLPNSYSTDEIRAQAEGFIASTPGPWFLVVAPFAPHRVGNGLPVPAPRHAGMFATEPFPTAASYNERNVSDKPAFIRANPAFTSTQTQFNRTFFRARLETLLAVDELVAGLESALVSSGQDANSVRIYTSDNGWLNGQHRWLNKEVLYEESIRIPLIVRGPDYPSGATLSELVGTADLTPTLATLMEATPTRVQDGADLGPLLRGEAPLWRSALLLNSRDRTSYDAVRTTAFTYAEHLTGELELYDLAADPFQLASKHKDPAYAATKASLAATLATLKACVGSGCWVP
jgi:arylsulfatase A-like enzyme